MNTITPEAQQKTPDILIVDDTPEILQFLVLILKAHGYRVRPVLSGALAIQAVLNEPPDLILLDIRMPDMNGFEVCEYLKADKMLKEIPVIFVSGLADVMDKVKAFAVGGVDYVTKPFQFEEVYARIETQLKIRSLQRQLQEQNENLERLVAERTLELAKAYERLQELGRIKDDFLRMLSHEIRTPANGVLGIGNLILDLCPASEDRTQYADLFEQSALRLRNLIEDTALLTDMENQTCMNGAAISFPDLFAEVRASLPDIQISMDRSAALDTFCLKGCQPLLKRALESVILIAASFSQTVGVVHVTGSIEERGLCLHLDVDALTLSGEQASAFFEIESDARNASAAEWMGLAPVVAHQIISAFGGEMKLVKRDGASGYLEAILLKEPTSLSSSP